MTDRPLVHYWLILYRRRGLIVVTLLSSILFAWLLSNILPKVYEARCVMFVPATDARVSFTSDQNSGGLSQAPLFPTPDDQVAAMHIGILQSKALARKVSGEFPKKGLDALKKDVDFVMNSYYLLEIYVRDRNPQLAAAVANSYPKYFNELQRTFSLARFKDTRKILEEQIDDTTRTLNATRQQREDFQKKNRLVSIQEETDTLGRQRVELRGNLDDAEVGLKAAEQKIQTAQAQLAAEAKVYVPGESVTTNALIEQLRNKISDLEIRMAGQKMELTPEHPEVATLRAEYEEARKAMAVEIQRVVDSQTKSPGSVFESLRLALANAHLDRQVTEARVAGLREALERLDRAIADVPGRQRQLEDLDELIKQQESALDILRRKLDEVGTQARWEYRAAVVVEQALPPEIPAFPVLWLNLAVGGLLGLLGGILYAFFIEYVRETQRQLQFGDALEPARGAAE
jgi:uncharacterized protein involved in exopolysaccharide biosynthesis